MSEMKSEPSFMIIVEGGGIPSEAAHGVSRALANWKAEGMRLPFCLFLREGLSARVYAIGEGAMQLAESAEIRVVHYDSRLPAAARDALALLDQFDSLSGNGGEIVEKLREVLKEEGHAD